LFNRRGGLKYEPPKFEKITMCVSKNASITLFTYNKDLIYHNVSSDL